MKEQNNIMKIDSELVTENNRTEIDSKLVTENNRTEIDSKLVTENNRTEIDSELISKNNNTEIDSKLVTQNINANLESNIKRQIVEYNNTSLISNIEYSADNSKSVFTELENKLHILTDAAKYDVACTSSGVSKKGGSDTIGNATACGICHTFSADGRCVSLLKILMTNECIFDCKYCINRCSNDVPRATFTPDEICRLTIEFYRRNYIEGLFLSSGILKNPTYTMELIYETVRKLRKEYKFAGYIHIKGIPGADKDVIEKAGYLADRMSVNLELPTAEGLKKLAPNKNRKNILTPMRQIQNGININKEELVVYRHAPKFVPAGQSTQMIIGASKENDYEIMSVSEALYNKYQLKRVFYSAFVAVNNDANLPVAAGGPPLLREHRLYQADWLLRFYGFKASELLSEAKPNFNVFLDPKCEWAIRHLDLFPVEINKADYYTLLRVPGIGVYSARRIVAARRAAKLGFDEIKRMGVVLKRAVYFITCMGKMQYDIKMDEDYITSNIIYGDRKKSLLGEKVTYKQLSLFDCQS